ncbi:MAG TPA: hypothetical protein VMS01_04010, partial [Stellaceae bacterium]|nr:hypothetical protein [Stellaceae bacterium]
FILSGMSMTMGRLPAGNNSRPDHPVVLQPGMIAEASIVPVQVHGADSDDVARSFRDHVARCSDMMSPA